MSRIKKITVKKSIKNTIKIITLVIIMFGIFLLSNYFTYNLHTVIPHRVYRSAILPKHKLFTIVKKYHIKTLLNLTGEHDDLKWYKNERAVSNQLHIKHIDFSLPAHGKISSKRMQNLVTLLRDAKQPILVHCRQGADRTGLASAILVILHGNYTTGQWQHQISWRYNAVSPSSIGYEVMMNYLQWLQKNKLRDNKKHFIAWAYNHPRINSHRGWFFD